MCGGTGIIIDKATNTGRPCKCYKQEVHQRFLKSSRITPAFRGKTFANFKLGGRPDGVQKLAKAASDYARRFHELRHSDANFLTLAGEPGCGKTHLAIAVANALMAQRVGVTYFQHVEGIGELIDAIKATGDDSIGTKKDQLKRADVLLWDDLLKPVGTGESKVFELKTVYEIINYRYLNLLPTIITTERTPEELNAIDKGIARRILERSRGHMVVVEGAEANYSLYGE